MWWREDTREGWRGMGACSTLLTTSLVFLEKKLRHDTMPVCWLLREKFNGINRFCGTKEKKIWQVLQHSCSCEHRSGCHIAFHCEKYKGKPERVLQPRHSFPSGELQSWAWCMESLCTPQLHCMLLWNMSQYFTPMGNKSYLLRVNLLMLVGTLSCY